MKNALPKYNLARYTICHIILFSILIASYFVQEAPFQNMHINKLNSSLVIFFIFTALWGQVTLIANTLHALIFLYEKYSTKWISVISILLSSGLTFSLISDRIVFHIYHYHINTLFLQYLFTPEGRATFAFSNSEWFYILPIFIFAVFIETILFYTALYVSKKNPHRTSALWNITGWGMLILSYAILLISGTDPHLETNSVLRNHLIGRNAQVIPFYFLPLSFILPKDLTLERLPNYNKCIFPKANPNGPTQQTKPLQYPLHPLRYHAKTKPNIIMIGIDAWRFNNLNPKNTPNLWAFAQKNTQFQQHLSGGNSTQAGLFSLFYNLPIVYWDATIEQKIRPPFMRVLAHENYTFHILMSASPYTPPFDRNIFLDLSPPITPGKTPYERDNTITQNFLDFLKKPHSQPFFTFLFYDATHSFCADNDTPITFQPIEKYCSRLFLKNNSDPLPYKNRYYNGLFADDQMIGKILDTLKAKKLLDNTIVIITSDHGEEFNDNHKNFWGHGSNYTPIQTKVPLIIHWPKQPAAIYTHATSHYDIIPTLLQNVFHCDNPIQDYSFGKNLKNTTPAPYLYSASYVDEAILMDQKIITLYPAGYYAVYDQHYDSLSKTQLDFPKLFRALKNSRRYFKSN
jgi:membrane-anchored protein YejM (alkaline phosphatase superfamily)